LEPRRGVGCAFLFVRSIENKGRESSPWSLVKGKARSEERSFAFSEERKANSE
jgi:hypothetical protein